MIDEANKIIYIDFSIGNTFQACKEKARLAYHLGYRTGGVPALDFGHAVHAGMEGYFNAKAGGFIKDSQWHKFSYEEEVMPREPLNHAKASFFRDLKLTGASLPLNLEADERRSVERGIALIEAHTYRWRNDLYENMYRPDGSPLVEVPFQVEIGNYNGYRIIVIGKIDRIMRSIRTGRPAIFETKTTTQGLSNFIKQVKPNHQITTYFAGAWEFLPDIRECIWDCVFVSDRKPDMKKALLDRFWMYGIDIEKDFARQTTTRTPADVEAWKFDILAVAIEYANWLWSGARRWPRSAPSACHQYGGCQFRDVCPINNDDERERYLESKFVKQPWEPWKEFSK
jgi:hypothetical protein